MNNTTTGKLTAIVAVLMAATLVVGTFATTTLTQTALAFSKNKKDNGKGNGNGNTVTIEECKNKESVSGFDTATMQECENLICTHPGENATCVQEGAAAVQQGNQTTPVTPPTPVKPCEQCFMKFLTPDQLSELLNSLTTPGQVTLTLDFTSIIAYSSKTNLWIQV
jgi:hypothetical protein